MRRSLTASSPIPTYLYVFKSSSAFDPYRPRVDGKPSHVDGYFQQTSDGNYISLTASWNSDPRPLIYHEYLHDFLHANFPPQPLWFDEGTAEFYRSFRATGREAQIGLPVEEHIGLLRESAMMPLERLFAVTRDSPEYNEQLRKGVFYAQSWALVHYLLRGNPERTPQLARFLVLLQQGRPRDAAFREAFGIEPGQLFSELYAYVRGSRYAYARYGYPELAVPTETKVESLSYEESAFRLGDLLAHGPEDRLDDAEAYFRAVLDSDPAHAGALGGLGFVRLRQRRYPEAAGHFRSAVAGGRADFKAHYYDGWLRWDALARRPADAGTDALDRELEDARAAFRQSIALNPGFPEARAALGRTYLGEDPSKSDEGIAALETAGKMLPSRPDIAMDLATLYERRDDRVRAEAARKRFAGEANVPPRQAGASEPSDAAGGEAIGDALEEVNVLLSEGREDEAIALLEGMVARSGFEYRQAFEEELRKLRDAVARNRARRRYNSAIALYNSRDFARALAAFDELAGSPDPEVAKAAREKAEALRRERGSGRRPPTD